MDKDAWAIYYFASELGLEMGLALSFAKNMGLYGMMSVYSQPRLSRAHLYSRGKNWVGSVYYQHCRNETQCGVGV